MILSVATLLCPKLLRQLASSPQFATCMQQVCSTQSAASLQYAICSKSAVRNCSKSAVRKLHQVCSSQLAAGMHSSQLAASLLTTCSRLDIIKSEQPMRTHPDIGLMIASCKKPAADLLQLARFWLYISPSHFNILSKNLRNMIGTYVYNKTM